MVWLGSLRDPGNDGVDEDDSSAAAPTNYAAELVKIKGDMKGSSSLLAALSAGVKYQKQHHVNICGSILLNSSREQYTVSARPCYALNSYSPSRNFSSQEVTKNLRLLTPEDVKPPVDQKSLTVQVNRNRPLVVFLEWMSAQRGHVKKFTDLYLGSGYDVLVAPLTPSQLLFPTRGSQVMAAELAQFLANNNHYSRILVHGFSIGGYLWGEVELLLSRDSSRYSSVIKRIHGQVWDSVVGLESIIKGFPLAVFPRNFILRTAFSKYLGIHLWMFKNVATKHYEASSACFHHPPVKAPALVLASYSDPICSLKEMMEVVDDWRDDKIQVTVKLWDDSPHVGHLRKHRKEYIFELNNFLKSLQLPVVHDDEADKLSSKL